VGAWTIGKHAVSFDLASRAGQELLDFTCDAIDDLGLVYTAEGLAACRSKHASIGKSIATLFGAKFCFKNSPLPHKRSMESICCRRRFLSPKVGCFAKLA
jgi:hypothetical protein